MFVYDVGPDGEPQCLCMTVVPVVSPNGTCQCIVPQCLCLTVVPVVSPIVYKCSSFCKLDTFLSDDGGYKTE